MVAPGLRTAGCGGAFQFPELASFKSDVAIGGLLIYVACFAFGLGTIFWLMISEIYPLKNRRVAMSAVTVTNWAMNLLEAVTFLSLVSVLEQAGDEGEEPGGNRGTLARREIAGSTLKREPRLA